MRKLRLSRYRFKIETNDGNVGMYSAFLDADYIIVLFKEAKR